MSASSWLLTLDSCGTSLRRSIFWNTVTGCLSVQTASSHTSGLAAQFGMGSGAGGLQQSCTTAPAPQGTTGVWPAGMPNFELSKAYFFVGRSNVTLEMSELMRPQP